jgi:hypothetical protein
MPPQRMDENRSDHWSIEDAHRQEQGEARREQAWLELFGMKPPPWGDEAKAPPLDQAALERFARKESPDEEWQRIVSLSLRFRSWARGVVEALRRDRRKSE